MSVLDYDILPREAGSDLEWMRRDGFVFRVDNHFARQGLEDRALTGVYQDAAGRKGRFLLVLQRHDRQQWAVGFLHKEVGEAGFSVLTRKATGLYWGTCMQCSEFSRLVLKDGKLELEAEP
jgi:hypothetical protein